ncbi:MAG TPA: hypothetical protein VHF22_04470 [Planctomycetota bacterium]|nr:hypothetical protein [Planctomycetota bacterium]
MIPEAPIFERLIKLLREKYDYVVIGCHARNAYVEPRVTTDLDLILPEDQARAFAQEAVALIPRGSVKDRPGFVRLIRNRKPCVDIGFTSTYALYEKAFSMAEERNIPAFGKARVPPAEALIAMKIYSSLSETRRVEKAAQDEADALKLLTKRNLDSNLLRDFAALVPGGPAKLEEMQARLKSRQGPFTDIDH